MRVKDNSWHQKFLNGLKECANVRMACELAGIERTTAYKARERHPEFRERWNLVVQDAIDSLEREAWRRAREGVTRVEPIMYQGEKVAEKIITEFSDNLITFLLKANRPGKYREQVKIITAQEADKVIDEALQKHQLPKPETFAGEEMLEPEM